MCQGMSHRNPSPPAELAEELQHVDQIGDTAYSKCWLYALLMKLLNLVKSSSSSDLSEIHELDQELEEQLCCLWDLTVNHNVLPHLEDFDLVPIFTDVLTCHQYPRLLEIIVGILANLAYNPKACRQMTDNDVLVNRVISLFYSRDTPTLTEVCRFNYRLVQTILASEEDNAPWITAIRFQSDFIDCVHFILNNSTHGHLLIATIRLLDAITREDDSLAEVWCGSALLDAILVAQRQMRWLYGSEVEVIHRVLYTFSSNVGGVSALIRSFDQVLPTFGVYLRKVCEDEPHLIPFSAYYNSIRAIVPIIDAVSASLSPSQSVSCCSADKTVLPCLIHIALGCQCQAEEFPLGQGILTDLSILFGDMVKSIRDALKSITSSSGSLLPAAEMFDQDLSWLHELDASDDDSNRVGQLRKAFVTCCLQNNEDETRGRLIYICNRLKLSRLLEELTDDN